MHNESFIANVTFIMQRTSFKNMECPAARALERVGEWWSILILRDAFHGLSRFDEFQKSLGIASNILTRRLQHLTDNGLLERFLYNERPPRYEYRLTTHASSRTGVRASCPDCHVPKSFGPKMFAKMRASKDVYHNILGTINTPEKYEALMQSMLELHFEVSNQDLLNKIIGCVFERAVQHPLFCNLYADAQGDLWGCSGPFT